jgi:hypothetical protein
LKEQDSLEARIQYHQLLLGEFWIFLLNRRDWMGPRPPCFKQIFEMNFVLLRFAMLRYSLIWVI